MKMLILILVVLPGILFAQSKKTNDLWRPFKFFIGIWEGKGEGKWGASTIEREYQFIMGGTFLLGKNKSVYEKQERNPQGEIHDNWDIISYDKGRKKFVLRQFHAEDIVNQYVVDSIATTEKKFDFLTEAIENFGNGWRAKESYEILNENEFIENFYLAAPGKEFQVFVRNHFIRK